MKIGSPHFSNLYIRPDVFKEMRERKPLEGKEPDSNWISEVKSKSQLVDVRNMSWEQVEEVVNWATDHIITSDFDLVDHIANQYTKYRDSFQAFAADPSKKEEAMQKLADIYERAATKVADKVTKNYDTFLSNDNVAFIKQNIVHIAKGKVGLPSQTLPDAPGPYLQYDQVKQLDTALKGATILVNRYSLHRSPEFFLTEDQLGASLGTLKAFLDENLAKAGLPSFLQDDINKKFDSMMNRQINELIQSRKDMLAKIANNPRIKTSLKEIDRDKLLEYMRETIQNYKSISFPEQTIVSPFIDLRV